MKDRYWEWSSRKYKADENGRYLWAEVEPELGKRVTWLWIDLEWSEFKFKPIHITFNSHWLSLSVALAWVEVELFIKWREDKAEEEDEHA